MLLTIITRTYAGREHLIAKASGSVLSQTYRPIEWLIVEDGPSGSRSALSNRDFRDGLSVKIVTNAKDGRSAAANRGLDEASGDLLCFFDDDDELFPLHAQTLIDLLRKHPTAAGAYAAAYRTPIRDGTPDYPGETVFLAPTVGSYPLMWLNLFPIQAVVFRRSAVQWNRFDTNLDALEDWLFWLSVFLERKLVWTPNITSRFFVPSGQTGDDRLDSHYEAQQYFDVQKNALLRERGVQNIDRLRQHHEGKLLDIFAASYAKNAHVGPAKQNQSAAKHPSSARMSIDAGLAPVRLHQKVASRISANVVFTSITLGYLPKALVLARSVKKHHPDWEFHILLNDQVPPGLFAKLSDVDALVNAASLQIENFHGWSFGMSLVEFCCATKPTYFAELLDKGYENVFFIDPDIKLFSDLGYLVERLRSDDVLVTPHCDKPAKRDSEVYFTERSVLAHGLYNLGFLAARGTKNGREIIEFWRSRLTRYCHDDHRNGLFNDQKWFNLVPLYFKNVGIVEHEGCNTASWNISHRPISIRDGRIFSGRDPLMFFHFSGYDAKVPRAMFEIFGQYNAGLDGIISQYDAEVASMTSIYQECMMPWAFRSFDNADEIHDSVRRFYRSSLDHRVMFREPYFADGTESFYEHVRRGGLGDIIDKHSPMPYG